MERTAFPPAETGARREPGLGLTACSEDHAAPLATLGGLMCPEFRFPPVGEVSWSSRHAPRTVLVPDVLRLTARQMDPALDGVVELPHVLRDRVLRPVEIVHRGDELGDLVLQAGVAR